MAICWERLSRQLFTVLNLNAVLVVLAPFGVWGGMMNLTVSDPDHYLFVCFSHSAQAQGHRRLLKGGRPLDAESVPRVPKARDGRARKGVSPSRKGDSVDLAREKFGFRKAVDAFLLHLECNFGL